MSSNTHQNSAGFFGHPKGLSTLFFTEMWERMSYYGMRALLVMFMTASLQKEGLAFTAAAAAAIYGLYTGAVYFLGLPGGWIADRLLGGQRTVWYGGIIIMCGHIVLAIPSQGTFFVGLILVATGTGLLKPNISALVGHLYQPDDVRRDSGYALYYMGINLGSFIGYMVVGTLGEKVGWHWGFGAAAVGMAIGLIQYRKTIGNLGDASLQPEHPMSPQGAKKAWGVIWAIVATVAVVAALSISGVITINPVAVAQNTAVIFTLIFFAYYAYIYFGGNLSQIEKRRMWALFLVCLASACFWSGFEQAGSSLTLFTQDFTNRMVGSFEIPVSWFQNINPLTIIILSPFFAALWINLGKRMITPSYSLKCAIGLIIMASGFIVMFFAAQQAAAGLKVAPFWLVATYFLHTVGELCLSPVALSAVSKLSPRRFAGQMMGVFVLTYSIGNIIAGLLAGNFDPNNVSELPNLYLQIAIFSIGIGAVIALISLKSKSWEGLGQGHIEPVEPAEASAKTA
ncbi:peptide MFS transporter [Microbulbifer bruguierae]|uniref:Peptide MFS transporter n=1 Tax=Microbulbifer bruguierae TaxID=3029061 RepID=A0ABY8NBP7_9GAMM|nr:peptide MFS transporter [Microbulbifer bruguierae]WGL16351.1 peptide MFS transporter [Microbulbifer bruguierae]